MAILDRLSFLVDADTRGAEAGFRRVGASAEQNLGKAEGAVSKVGVSGTAMAAGLAVGAAAITAVSAAAVKGVQSFVDLTEQADHVQDVTGASAEQASSFASVLRRLGIDVDTGATALFRFGRNVETNGAVLQAQGLQIARNADGTVDLVNTLLNLSDAYRSTADQGQRNALVQAALGRGGEQLIDLLEKGRGELTGFFDAADRHGEVFSQNDIDKGKEYQIAIRDLNAEFAHLERDVGVVAMPVIKGLAGFLDRTSIAFERTGGWISRNILGHKEHRQAVEDDSSAIDNYTSKLEAATEALTDRAKANDSLHQSERRVADATSAVQAAVDKLQRDKSRDLTAELQAATDALTSARNQQSRAVDTEAAAERRLNDLRKDDYAKLIADAERKAADARTSHAHAIQNEVEAQAALQRARDIGASPNEIRDAELALEDAHNAVADTAAAAGDAEDGLTDARKKGNSTIVKDAERDLSDARIAVNDATRSARDAEQKLNEVRANNRAKALADDERDLQRAVEDQAAAMGKAAADEATAAGNAAGAVTASLDAQFKSLGNYRDALGRLDPVIRDFINNRLDELQRLALPPGTQGPINPNTPPSGFLPHAPPGPIPNPNIPPPDLSLPPAGPPGRGGVDTATGRPLSSLGGNHYTILARDVGDALAQIAARERLNNLTRG